MKRLTKYVFLVICGTILFSMGLFVMVAVTFDNNDYRKIAIHTMEHFTGCKVSIDGDFSLELSVEPYLTVSGLRFAPGKDGNRPLVSSINRLELKLAATRLIKGTLLIKQLLVDEANMALTVGGEQDVSDAVPPRNWNASYLIIPVFERINLKRIKVNVFGKTNENLATIDLRQLIIDDRGENGYRHVRGEGMVNLQDFRIAGRLGAFAKIFSRHQPYPVALNLSTANMNINVSGSVDNFVRRKGIDLHVTGEVTELSKSLQLFRVECPGLGYMKLAAHVTGDMGKPSVSDLSISIDGEPDTQITAKGTINNLLDGSDTHMLINGTTRNRNLIRMLLPGIVNDFSQLSLRGRLRDRQTEYILEEIDAVGANDDGLTINAQGLLSLGGLIKDPVLKKINLNLQLNASTTEAAKRFLVDGLPEIGPVTGKGRLIYSDGRLFLEDLSMGINASGPLTVACEGRIDQIPTRQEMSLSGVDLALSIRAERTQLIASALNIPLPELGLVTAQYRLRYAEDRIQIDQVNVHTTNSQGLTVELSGNIENIPVKDRKPPGNVNLRIHMTAPNVGATKPLLGVSMLTDIGPVVGETQVVGTTDMLALENVLITAGHPNASYAKMQGRIGKIDLKREPTIAACDIFGFIQTDEAHSLGSFFDVSIPNLGPLRGTWRLVDRNGVLGMDDIKLSVGQKNGFRLEAEAKIDAIDPHADVSVAGIELDMQAVISQESSISLLNNMGLSRMGVLQIKTKMSGGKNGLDVRQLTIHARQKDRVSLLMKGEIHGTRRKDEIKVKGKFETHSRPWVENLMRRPVSDSFKLVGQLNLTGNAKHIIIDQLQFETAGKEPLTLNARGVATKMHGSYQTDVKVSANANDPSVIGSMLGISLPPLSPLKANGRFNIGAEEAVYEGDVRLGKTIIKINAHRSFQNHKPHVNLTLYSPVIYLSDMGIYPEVEVKETDKKEAKPTPKLLFGRESLSFDVFKSFNFALNMDADRLVGKDFEMSALDIDLLLSDGWLRIGPAKLDYAGGNISFETSLKNIQSRPEISLKANIEDLNVDAFLAYAHKPLILGGQLNLAVDLYAIGDSPRDIASSISGEFGVALENGRIKRDIEMITADAFDVITALPKLKNYQNLNCLILKFIFEEGVGKSKIIFYDTPNVRTRGAGSVDLRSENIDIVLQPNPKKGIPELSSAIYISGPLANPSIRKIPFKEAARLAGEILMPYVFLPARALGYLWYLLKEDMDEQSPCFIEESDPDKIMLP